MSPSRPYGSSNRPQHRHLARLPGKWKCVWLPVYQCGKWSCVAVHHSFIQMYMHGGRQAGLPRRQPGAVGRRRTLSEIFSEVSLVDTATCGRFVSTAGGGQRHKCPGAQVLVPGHLYQGHLYQYPSTTPTTLTLLHMCVVTLHLQPSKCGFVDLDFVWQREGVCSPRRELLKEMATTHISKHTNVFICVVL